jgi:broad specificity phosphatase PhoE
VSAKRLLSANSLFLTLALLLVPVLAAAQKLVIVVRHAERADGGPVASAMTGVQDPPLSAAGTARAARLATMFADAGVKAVFSSEYRRTQDTAKPLADKLGLQVQTIPAKDLPGLVARLKSQHAQDVVVVVGHSNTVPAIVKQFGGGEITVPEDDYTSLFIVVPATGTVTRIRY